MKHGEGGAESPAQAEGLPHRAGRRPALRFRGCPRYFASRQLSPMPTSTTSGTSNW
jgi:hypothetical protein